MTEPHENSLAAFRAIMANESISEAKLIVAHALWQHPKGMTRNEIDRMLSPGTINSRFSRRLVELERAGLIARSGSRECSVSHNTCDVWVYDPHTPAERKPVPRMPSPDEAAALAAEIDIAFSFVTPTDTLRVLLTWLDAGAPRCAEARRVPKRRKPATLAEVFAEQEAGNTP